MVIQQLHTLLYFRPRIFYKYNTKYLGTHHNRVQTMVYYNVLLVCDSIVQYTRIINIRLMHIIARDVHVSILDG